MYWKFSSLQKYFLFLKNKNKMLILHNSLDFNLNWNIFFGYTSVEKIYYWSMGNIFQIFLVSSATIGFTTYFMINYVAFSPLNLCDASG